MHMMLSMSGLPPTGGRLYTTAARGATDLHTQHRL
ncbi:unnamed protein product [Ectocarpus sp. CCAP 1310/34]|nr:unnamed protein product [Ectocarpus sp. CCAP 1310/34]